MTSTSWKCRIQTIQHLDGSQMVQSLCCCSKQRVYNFFCWCSYVLMLETSTKISNFLIFSQPFIILDGICSSTSLVEILTDNCRHTKSVATWKVYSNHKKVEYVCLYLYQLKVTWFDGKMTRKYQLLPSKSESEWMNSIYHSP